MATYLYKLGKFAYRRKGIVASAWVLILLLMGVAASTLSEPTKDTFSIPGTAAQEAQDLMVERFPEAAGSDPFNSISAKFVFAVPRGQTLDTPANERAMNDVIAKIVSIPEVKDDVKHPPAPAADGQDAGPDRSLQNPVVAAAKLTDNMTSSAEKDGTSVTEALANAQALAPLNKDKTVGYLEVPFNGTFSDITDTMRDQIKEAAQVGRDAGLTVEVGGSAANEQKPPGGSSELVGLIVAAIVLIITFGSLVAAGLPLISAIIGVAIGSLGITAATGFFELSSMTPTLAVMIGLAVAIDYSLFILSRFKHELTLTDDRAEAAGRAVGTAGSAVVFAGLTVVIALVALRVVGIPFLADMGAAAAFTVLIAVLIALTLLPAVLGLFGRKAFGGQVPFLRNRGTNAGADRETNGLRWAKLVVRIPAVTLIAGIALLGILTIPAAGLKLALPGEGSADPATGSRQAFDLVNDGFGPGRNGPLLVVVDAAEVAPGEREDAFSEAVKTITSQRDVTNAQVFGQNEAGDTAQILVTPTSSPSSTETQDLVKNIRGAEGEFADRTGASYGVTGQTALELDVSDRLSGALIPYLAIVVGLAFLLLMLVFRSILVPLTAALGFLLSVAATFGVTVAIFQEGWFGLIDNTAPIVSFMPIFLIGVVFGLAMDYQVFLVTRMREEYVHGASAREAVIHGFRHGARVVTAAAVIMISVFAAFMAEPDSFIKSIGFALAAAVFFDAFIVRMVIIPSVLALLGDKAWWLPKWLDRILPNVDIGGEKLTRALPAAPVQELEPVGAR